MAQKIYRNKGENSQLLTSITMNYELKFQRSSRVETFLPQGRNVFARIAEVNDALDAKEEQK